MEISKEVRAGAKPFAWGLVIGAVALAVGGAFWPGWSIESNIKTRVAAANKEVLVNALAPVCAEKFRTEPNLDARAAELKGVSSWQRDKFLVDGKYVVKSGAVSTDQSIGAKCANLLDDLTKK